MDTQTIVINFLKGFLALLLLWFIYHWLRDRQIDWDRDDAAKDRILTFEDLYLAIRTGQVEPTSQYEHYLKSLSELEYDKEMTWRWWKHGGNKTFAFQRAFRSKYRVEILAMLKDGTLEAPKESENRYEHSYEYETENVEFEMVNV